MLPGAAEKFEQALKDHGTTEASPLLEEAMALSREYERDAPPIDVEERDKHWRTFNQAVAAFMSDYDVVICPVNAYPAMKHGTTWSEVKAFTYGMTWNLTGHPAAVVRCGMSSKGLPIGVQVVGRLFREDVVFAVAEYLEEAIGGWLPPPI
jgi:amidase